MRQVITLLKLFGTMNYYITSMRYLEIDPLVCPGDIFRTLEHTEGFQGVTGTISFSPASHVPLKTVWVIAVQNGEKSLATAFVPASVPPPILDAP